MPSPGNHRRDLRRACSRSLLLVLIAVSATYLYFSTTRFLLSAALFGLLPLPLSLVEFRGARRSPGLDESGTWVFGLWLIATALLECLVLQAVYVHSGGLEGLATGYATLLLGWLGGAGGVYVVLPFLLGIPFAMASLPRILRAEQPLKGSFAIALLGVPFLLTGLWVDSGLQWAGLSFMVTLLFVALLYSAGDGLEAVLWPSRPLDEFEGLSDRTLAFLGHLQHAPALEARNVSASSAEQSLDLGAWIKGLEVAGMHAMSRAALALARLAEPHWSERSQDPAARTLTAALAACVDEPGAETRQAAAAALTACQGVAETWEVAVFKAATRAVSAEGDWAVRLARIETCAAARTLAEHYSEAQLREAIREAVVPWVLAGGRAP